jgi:hypothetical protein
MTVAMAAKLRVSDHVLRSSLASLVEKGQATRTGVARGTRYAVAA